MKRCKHIWISLLPDVKELPMGQSRRTSYVVDKMLSGLGRDLICTECERTGHNIKSHRGGIRIHRSDYFLKKAQELSQEYGFKIPFNT